VTLGAFVAVADDANSAYWNPAGLTRLEAREVTYTYWRLSDVSGVGVNHAALGLPLTTGRWQTAVGLSVTRVGAELEEGPAAQQSKIADSRYSLALGLGLNDIFSVGITLNRLQIDSDVESGSGFGFEFGVLAKPLEEQKLYLGATGRNLSADIKNEHLEEAWRLGAAWTVWEDRITMAFSLEGRVPLLDRRLLRTAMRLAPEARVAADGRPKALFREADAAALPPAVRDRKDKMGFPLPLGEWLRGPWRAFAGDTLLDARTLGRGMLERRGVEAALMDPGRYDRGLYAALALELWCRAFLDE